MRSTPATDPVPVGNDLVPFIVTDLLADYPCMAAISVRAGGWCGVAIMVMLDGAASSYVLGHSDRELERLRLQAQLINLITRQFLIEAGITSGMRVLDVGCGAGDVTFLAANLVGPAGQVVGGDRAVAALATTRTRADAQPLANVTFYESELSAMAFDQAFD